MKKKAAKKSPTPRKAAAKSKSHPEGGKLSVIPAIPLFDRVATILDAARSSVVRAVNSRMVLAYWLIGREIVQDLQSGDERAEYGKRVISELSAKLTQRYGAGYSAANLWLFRQFYQVFQERQSAILNPLGRESETPGKPAALRLQIPPPPTHRGRTRRRTQTRSPRDPGREGGVSSPVLNWGVASPGSSSFSLARRWSANETRKPLPQSKTCPGKAPRRRIKNPQSSFINPLFPLLSEAGWASPGSNTRTPLTPFFPGGIAACELKDAATMARGSHTAELGG